MADWLQSRSVWPLSYRKPLSHPEYRNEFSFEKLISFETPPAISLCTFWEVHLQTSSPSFFANYFPILFLVSSLKSKHLVVNQYTFISQAIISFRERGSWYSPFEILPIFNISFHCCSSGRPGVAIEYIPDWCQCLLQSQSILDSMLTLLSELTKENSSWGHSCRLRDKVLCSRSKYHMYMKLDLCL